MTKPSRSRSKGREASSGGPVHLERAFIRANEPISGATKHASAPPATTASARPVRSIHSASPIACAELAQAEATAKQGPRAPSSVAISPGATFARSAWIANGESREGPHESRTRTIIAALRENSGLRALSMHGMGPYRRTLEVIRIERPCPEAWGKLEGSGALRFCRICESNVYDLSEMTRSEAEELLALTGDRICVRFFQRADGTIATKDCTGDREIHRRRRARKNAAAGAAAMLLASAAAAAVSSLPAAPPPRPPPAARRALPIVPHPTWIDPEALPPLPDPPERVEPERGYTTPGAYMGGGLVPFRAEEPTEARVTLGEPDIVGGVLED